MQKISGFIVGRQKYIGIITSWHRKSFGNTKATLISPSMEFTAALTAREPRKISLHTLKYWHIKALTAYQMSAPWWFSEKSLYLRLCVLVGESSARMPEIRSLESSVYYLKKYAPNSQST